VPLFVIRLRRKQRACPWGSIASHLVYTIYTCPISTGELFRKSEYVTSNPSMMAIRDKVNPYEYLFRGVHSDILIGMASDRYAGWIGQIYSADRYKNRIMERKHTVGGKTFTERVLPVESVREYFEHFPVLEIDYTFYRLLLDEKGNPTQNDHVLSEYKRYLKDGDLLILKVPQVICARKVRRGGKLVANGDYLDPEVFTKQFYRPAIDILGSNLGGFIFEQEYHPKNDRHPIDELARLLDAFFMRIPKDTRYHIELRTEAYLVEPVFEVLKRHGIGLVFSHWTWLPPLSKQLAKEGGRFFNSGNTCIVRLITPLRVKYEDSYAKAFPFDRLVDGMLNLGMIDDTVDLITEVLRREIKIAIIINNRAGGNGPLIANEIVQKLLAKQI
jgi:uncharacterized protein YecE (DUF72 family)